MVSNQLNFERRARGIVWVCDLAHSSSYLNDDKTVTDLEEFLERFVFISRGIVEAASGQFIKWTGDGFLAWLPTPLHRTLGYRSLSVLNAAWHLSFMVNVTQLGLEPMRKFKIRHGMAYEQDALLIRTPRANGDDSLDLIGRAIVLAFRLSSIPAKFPDIVTQDELLNAARSVGHLFISFSRLKFTQSDRLKFFKGERWQTSSIYASADRRPQHVSPKSLKKQLKRTIRAAEGREPMPTYQTEFSEKYQAFMQTGPEWCRQVWEKEHHFLHRMFSVLKDVEGSLQVTMSDRGRLNEAPPERAS